jgi:tetratricopeptide (TPR) repeat protein
MDYAKALYNVGASLCALSCFRNHMTLTCFEEARDIFAEGPENKSFELASCLFYMSQTIYHRAGKDSDLLNKATDLLKESTEIYRELGMVTSNNEPDQSLDGTNGALQAHLFCLQGWIHNAMGNTDLALGSFQTAYSLYDSDSVLWSLHKAAVLFAVGKIYKNWEENVGALRCFDEAMEIRISRLGPGHEVVGANLHELGDMFARRGDFEVAMEMYNEARRILVATAGQDSPLVAKVLLHLGALQARQGLLGDALESLKGALVIRNNRASMVFEESRRGDSSELTTVSRRQESPKELQHDDALIKQFHQDLAHERQELAVVLHCTGTVHNALLDYENAVLSYDKAIETWRSNTEPMSSNDDIPISLADSLHCLGCVYFKQKEYEKALECLTESLKLKRDTNSPHMLLEKSGKTTASSTEQAHSIVLHNARKDPSSNEDVVSLSYASTLHWIGMVHSRMNNRDAAVSCLESCLTIQKRLLDAESPEIAVTLADMGNILYSAKHRRDEAVQYYQQALAIRKSQHSHSRAAGELLYRIGSLHDADRQAAQAMLYYRQAVQVYGRRYVHSISKRFCRAVLLRTNSLPDSDDDEAEDHIDLFQAADFSSATESLEDREEHQRAQFRQVCAAMRRVATSHNRVDASSPSCLISLELYLYSLMDLLHLVAGEWRHAARQSLQSGMRQLQGAGTGTPSTTALPSSSQDMMLFHMLYLIQE